MKLISKRIVAYLGGGIAVSGNYCMLLGLAVNVTFN